MTVLQIKQGVNKKIFYPLRHMELRNKYKDKPVSFISSNCAGGVFSHDLGMPFCSPTINLSMSADDYIKFAENLRYYLEQPFEAGTRSENYPIGILDDIKLHCIHYSSFEEAKQKWTDRSKRILWDRIVYVMTDQNGCTREHVDRFMKLDGPKIFLTSKAEFSNYADSIFMDSEKYRLKHRNRTLVDDAFLFNGFSGKRNYEMYFSINNFLKREF